MQNLITTLNAYEYEIGVAGIRSPVLDTHDASSNSSASSEAVVYLHGNPGSSEDWRNLLLETGSFCRAVAFDMPGFGRADKPDDFTYTVDGYGDHFQVILERLGIERAHLVLHDFGGPWGLNWAGKYPESVVSVSLINTGYLLDYRWHYLAKIWRTPILGELFMAGATRVAFRTLFWHGNPRGLSREFVNEMFDNFDKATRRAVLKLYRATPFPDPQTRVAARALAAYDIPAFVLWGKADPYLKWNKLAEKQKEGFPSAQIVYLEDSGHWPYIDNPRGCADKLMPFLKEQTS